MILHAQGRIDRCLLVSLRVPQERVRQLAPPPLELLTHKGFAFFNVVACHIQAMRPQGAPELLGVNYNHIAYRLNVTCRNARYVKKQANCTASGDIQGLYFLRSDADHRLIVRPGNAFSDFRFHPADIDLAADASTLQVDCRPRDAQVALQLRAEDSADLAAINLAAGSPFASLPEAAGFLKYAPLGMAPIAGGRRLRLSEVLRDDKSWSERPVRLLEWHSQYLESFGLGDDLQLELATRITPIDYRWRLGRQMEVD